MLARSATESRRFGIGVSQDIGVEADLVRGVAGQHRSAARLRNIADQEPRPAVLHCLARQFLQQRDQFRMAPAAIAFEPHDLPGRPVDGHGDRAGDAALGIKAIGGGRRYRRQEARPKSCLAACWAAAPPHPAVTAAVATTRTETALRRETQENPAEFQGSSSSCLLAPIARDSGPDRKLICGRHQDPGIRSCRSCMAHCRTR